MNYRIKEVCRRKGLMMKDLAEKLGMTEVGLSKSLNGNPTVSRLEEIAKVLDVISWNFLNEKTVLLHVRIAGRSLK